MESEVFMMGSWKNFDELESSLSMEELLALIESLRKKDREDKKFLAAMQGVDLDSEPEQQEDSDDVSRLMNPNFASKEGFGVNEGLGFMEMGV